METQIITHTLSIPVDYYQFEDGSSKVVWGYEDVDLLLSSIEKAVSDIKSQIAALDKPAVVIEPKYSDIPSSPEFGVSKTISYADSTTGNIFSSKVVGFKDFEVSGTWDRLVVNGIIGDATTKVRFRNLDGQTKLGNASGAYKTSGCIGSLNNSNHVDFYGKSPLEPLVMQGNTNGIQWNPLPLGTDQTLQNIVTKGLGFAGVLINSSDKTRLYNKLDISFFRVFGSNAEGEVFYVGNTGTSYAMLNEVTIRNCFGTDKGRDGLQISSTYKLLVEKCTFYDLGKTNTAQQNHLFQVANSNGVIRDSIFEKAPRLCNIFAHDLVIENCYFSWSHNTFGYIGHAATTYPTFQTGNGKPIVFRNCIFDPSIDTDVLVSVAERTANVVFENCKFSTRIKKVFGDARIAGHTNQLIGDLTTNGNIQVAPEELPKPTYKSLSADDYLDHGLNTNLELHNRGVGYRA